jgi:hypothetical protein
MTGKRAAEGLPKVDAPTIRGVRTRAVELVRRRGRAIERLRVENLDSPLRIEPLTIRP